uniref:Uncharacterized protein n=1 Tax=Aquisalinus luteolus TaxID=1566827 RepID=A0A8J3A265_9PROT|nr:hypothetical protein GCM10011355_09270 [Aquisalinus luteolus]
MSVGMIATFIYHLTHNMLYEGYIPNRLPGTPAIALFDETTSRPAIVCVPGTVTA